MTFHYSPLLLYTYTPHHLISLLVLHPKAGIPIDHTHTKDTKRNHVPEHSESQRKTKTKEKMCTDHNRELFLFSTIFHIDPISLPDAIKYPTVNEWKRNKKEILFINMLNGHQKEMLAFQKLKLSFLEDTEAMNNNNKQKKTLWNKLKTRRTHAWTRII